MVVNQLAGLNRKKKPKVAKPTQAPKNPANTINFGDVNPAQNNAGGGFTGQGTFQASTQSFNNQPKPVSGTQNFLMFGQNAMGQETKSPGFLQKRNDFLAQDFFSKGIKDQNSIYTQLSNNPDFAASSEEDKQNTAKAIAERIGKQGQTPMDTTNTDDYFNQIMGAGSISSANANQFVDQAIGEYATGLEYGTKTAFDRPMENLQTQYDQAKLARKRQLEDLNTSITQQMEDVKMQAERNLGIVDKQGALQGFNRSSGYIQGRENIKNDAQRAIDRLQALWDTASSRDEEDLASLTDEFNQATKRVKEDFDYQYRNLLEQKNIDLNTIVGKYGLSSEKLNGELQNLTINTLQSIQDLENSYTKNLGQQISNVNSYLDTLQNQQKVNEIQFERTRNFLDQNDGENLTSISYDQIDELVNGGQLSQQDAQLYRAGIANKAYVTLKEYGVPTREDIDFMVNGLEQGYTPFQVVSSLIQKNPQRYAIQKKEAGFTLTPGQQRYDAQGNLIAKYDTGAEDATNVWSSLKVTNLGFRNGNMKDTGLDLDTEVGQVLPAPIGGTLQFVREQPGGEKNALGQTNVQMQLKTDDGYTITFNHLDPSVLQYQSMVGNYINAGDAIIVAGNTGKVLKMDGKTPTAAELQQGLGSHLDIRITDKNGKPVTGNAAQSILTGGASELNKAYTQAFNRLSPNLGAKDIRENLQKTINQAIKEGDYQTAQEAVFGAISSAGDTEQRKKFKENYQLTERLINLNSLIQQYKQSGGDMGIISGTKQSISERAGKVGDPKLKDIATRIAIAMDEFRRSRSGAALTEFEEQFYNNLFPSISKGFKYNEQTIATLVDELGGRMKDEAGFYLGPQNAEVIFSGSPIFSQTNRLNTTQTTTTGTKKFSSYKGR